MPEDTELSTESTPEGGSNEDTLRAEVEADLKALDETDPQRKLARAVEADLAELDSEGPRGGADKDGTQPEKDSQGEGDEFEAEKSRLAQVLKKRGEVFKERESAKAEAETIKAEALKAKQEVEHARAQVQQQVQQIRTFVQTLRTNPSEALRMAGIDPEEFLFGLAKDGTPEGAQAKELAELRKKTAEFENWKKEQEDQRRKALEQEQVAKATQFRKQVETQFVNTAKTKSESIKLAIESGLLNESSLIAEGDRIADQYREVTGQEASLEDIIEYIDERVSKAYNRIKGTHQAAVPPTQSKPAPSAKPGKKTLSQDDASVRTAIKPNNDPDESEDERRARAARAVRIVMEKAKARGAED